MKFNAVLKFNRLDMQVLLPFRQFYYIALAIDCMLFLLMIEGLICLACLPD